MNLKTLLKTAQWSNIVVLLAGVLNQVTQTFPNLAQNKWILIVQALLGILLPSLGGVAHAMAFKEAQAPGDRTVSQIASSAAQAQATMIAATPSGSSVTVPIMSTSVVKGTSVTP